VQLDPHAIHIRTDGSCYREKGMISGCAAIVEYPDHVGRERERIVDFGCGESTNNRMELLAVIRALRWIRENRPWAGVTRVQIITDSTYVKENILRAAEWRKNGWRNRHGEPMQNPDLWKDFLSVYSKVGMTVNIEWMHGKKSKPQKEIDLMAKTAGLRGGPDVDRGYARGAIAPSRVKDTAAIRFDANGQAETVRIYRKEVMKRAGGENKIRFDVFSRAEQRYVDSRYAYASPSIALELHRQHAYRVRFNSNPNYPQILEVVAEVLLPR
jgi:ribonuclease HI